MVEGQLEPGDIIGEMDQRTVSSTRALGKKLARKRPGEVALFKVRRDEQELYVAVRVR
jgi:S1-C subfamily serine protease